MPLDVQGCTRATLEESAAEVERICWDPKDGELYLSRMKPEETLVEVRSDSDVQIDRLTLV
ncbi:Highly reducing polyketide synthase ATR6 [Dirofilaria immitis]